MVQRSTIKLDAIADWHNLAAAFGRAAIGAGNSPVVERFRADLETNLASLQQQILEETVPLGEMTSFHIRDPKSRIIHAPCFRERVLHHALMAHVGPVLDRALVDDTFACRKGKGGLAAVQRCQHHLRRFEWFVQIDIKSFFANIDHQILLGLLQRKFKNPGVLRLLERIVCVHQTVAGRGLPIGALTSQHFANYYLAGLDRWLLEQVKVRGLVRYMDDLLWCCDTKNQARQSLASAQEYVANNLRIQIKQPPHIGRSRVGVLFCGYRVLPGQLLLSRRRKRRYTERRRYWETLFQQGQIDALKLQGGYAAVVGITAHADAAAWRREQLRRRPLENDLEVV
ncbi:MAG: RNA-directed DNA polymerase [Gammaproteobacteria bacterium]|nr:RNA-directed DNA polymerase [Gammaproteobacteria bacterium]